MSTEHAAKRIRVGGNREVGGGGVCDGKLGLILSSESALFLAVASYLSCQDAAALGSVDKERRQAYIAHRNALLEPTLKVLELMCGSNVHFYCGKTCAPASQCKCNCKDDPRVEPNDQPENQALADFDPRYFNQYDGLTTYEKARQMVAFLGFIVSNMRPHLKFTDAANPTNMPEVIGSHPEKHWTCGAGGAEDILQIYPRRAALAFNLALISYARSAMDHGPDSAYHFIDAFKGVGGIIYGGSSFGHCICETVIDMLPLVDDAFGKFLHDEILPSAKTRSTLGPVLTKRLVLCAPFDEWLDGDGEIVLPGVLEPFDDAVEQRFERVLLSHQCHRDTCDTSTGAGCEEEEKERVTCRVPKPLGSCFGLASGV